MSQFYPMKVVLEQVFGHAVYMKLKETGSFKDWQSETSRLLDAIRLAIDSTIEIADPEWREEIGEVLDLGQKHIQSAKRMDDLFAGLSATLARIAFLQIGMIPTRYYRKKRVPMKPENWTLDAFRSAQYVQSPQQKEALRRRKDALRASRDKLNAAHNSPL